MPNINEHNALKIAAQSYYDDYKANFSKVSMGEWLSFALVDAGMLRLQAKYLTKHPVYVAPTFSAQNFREQALYSGVIKDQCQQGIERTVARTHVPNHIAMLLEGKSELQLYLQTLFCFSDIYFGQSQVITKNNPFHLIIPVHLGNHYVSVVCFYDGEEFTARYLDSLSSEGAFPYEGAFRRALESIQITNVQVIGSQPEDDVQQDNNNCGVFCPLMAFNQVLKNEGSRQRAIGKKKLHANQAELEQYLVEYRKQLIEFLRANGSDASSALYDVAPVVSPQHLRLQQQSKRLREAGNARVDLTSSDDEHDTIDLTQSVEENNSQPEKKRIKIN